MSVGSPIMAISPWFITPMRVARRHRLFLVVGDDDEGDAQRFLDLDQLELGFLAQLLVERAERFVEQQQLWPLGQGAGQGHALALAARQLVRLALAIVLQLDQRQQFGDAVGDLGLGQVVALEAIGDVLLHVHVREQRIGLEHHVDGPVVGRHLRSCPGRRSRWCPRSAARSRPACAAASTCPSPSRRAGRTARPCRYRATRRARHETSPNFLVTLRDAHEGLGCGIAPGAGVDGELRFLGHLGTL